MNIQISFSPETIEALKGLMVGCVKSAVSDPVAPAGEEPKKGRGRPPKKEEPAPEVAEDEGTSDEIAELPAEPKKGRGRPPKKEEAPKALEDEESEDESEEENFEEDEESEDDSEQKVSPEQVAQLQKLFGDYTKKHNLKKAKELLFEYAERTRDVKLKDLAKLTKRLKA